MFALQEGLTRYRHATGLQSSYRSPGPALADLIGLDTMLAIMETLYQGFNAPKYRPTQSLKEMVAVGYPGRIPT
ncbi:3-hydroxyacyl-CoA dehydrogenase family protein [Pseudomonas citrulli]|uniref:3-hydroxyacyl-CoA dehydrogenase family protein n=1 Tax=Pseudomonas TaxID=286 RepID=UPI002286788B